jgi:3-deoxy-D-manno-octulosonic-acid transferase
MLLLYNLGISLYIFSIRIASLFNKKAKLWLNGRRNQAIKPLSNSVWFHFASLGEFEQGRPVLEKIREVYPGRPIVITFFSPSGYEIRKSTPLADAVYYLPADTASNAREFIATINPEIALFTKYEYWYQYFKELNKRNIPLYIISGIFRKEQVFFKWHGGLHRKMLSFVSRFFVQDENSKKLLQQLNIDNVIVSGDTRFDRVWANAQQPRQLPEIENFNNGEKLFIAGSTWPQDEELMVNLIKAHQDWKFIIAPHEIGEEKIDKLMDLLSAATVVKFSELKSHVSNPTSQILVIDNIGMLSSLYQYGKIAYIGGGFGVGIHNTLEAAAFGLPVIFGPNYQRFKEARDMIALGAAFTIGSQTELSAITDKLIGDENFRAGSGGKAKKYVEENIGATDTILSHINQ